MRRRVPAAPHARPRPPRKKLAHAVSLGGRGENEMFVPRLVRGATLGAMCCRRVWRTALFLFCSACLLATPALRAQAGRDLTVERIYSAPSLSGTRLNDTVWSPDGKWLSYLAPNADGGAEIRGVDAATGRRQ